MPFSFNVSKTHIEYSERDKLTAEKIFHVGASLPFIFQLGEESYCSKLRCYVRKTNLNLCNRSFRKTKSSLKLTDYGRIFLQISVLIRILVSRKLYFVDEIDLNNTVNFDPSGAIIFNLIQCEFVENPNHGTIDQLCFFLFRSLNSLFENFKTPNFYENLQKIRKSLINGTNLLNSLFTNNIFGNFIFLFGLNVENYFYVFDDSDVSSSVSHLDENGHTVHSGNRTYKVRCFRKNSESISGFITDHYSDILKNVEDWNFVYVIYSSTT
ncbi:hypothetical protein MHBO_002321 [Bonamia ostreae]